MERDWYNILPQTPSLGVDYSRLMVESAEDVLVNEERQPEAILAAVPPLIFFRWQHVAPLFMCFWSPPLFVMKINNPKAYIDGFISKQRERQWNRWYPRLRLQINGTTRSTLLGLPFSAHWALRSYFILLDAYKNCITRPFDLASFRVP
jgi:hypothetical protein